MQFVCLSFFVIGMMQAAASIGIDLNDLNGGSSSDLFFQDVNGNRIEFAAPAAGVGGMQIGFEHEIV